jgi:hypothetical protein
MTAYNCLRDNNAIPETLWRYEKNLMANQTEMTHNEVQTDNWKKKQSDKPRILSNTVKNLIGYTAYYFRAR